LGKSPFRAKGVNFRNVLAFAEAKVQGGQAQFLARLHHHDLRAFMAQPFLAASWYDALALIPLIAELSRELHLSTQQCARELAGFVVKRDATGIYKLLLKITTPESLLERSTHTARQYFDFVKSDFTRVDPRVYRLTHSGIPQVAATTYMNIVEGFVDAGLALAGAKEVRQRWERPQPLGIVSGVEIVRLEREIRWL
jgi:hypothetical protein